MGSFELRESSVRIHHPSRQEERPHRVRARKAIEEYKKGKRVVLVYPIDKWVLDVLLKVSILVKMPDGDGEETAYGPAELVATSPALCWSRKGKIMVHRQHGIFHSTRKFE